MKRVIKADSAASQATAPLELTDVAAEARRVLEEAHARADRLVSQAQDEAVKVFQDAAQRGHAEGLARGQAEGLRKAEQQAAGRLRTDTAELTALARKVLEDLSAARAELLEQGRQELLALAIEIAERIVGRVAVADLGAAQENLAKVLGLAGAAEEIVVQVNADQVEALRQYLPDLLELLAVRGQVRLTGDCRVPRGGAKLLSRHGEIDATIQTQLTNVVEALLGPGEGGAPAARQRPAGRANAT